MKPKRARNGAAYLAYKTGADVVPVSLFRVPDKNPLRPIVSIRFGERIRNEEFGFTDAYSPKVIREAAKRIMGDIVSLWEKGHIPIDK